MIREHWEERFKKRLELSRSKEEDYGSKDIPNRNFHRMAELCRILHVDTTTPKGVAQFHIVSKLDRMCNLLRDGRIPNNESVEDTMADMQNYIDILQDIRQEGGTRCEGEGRLTEELTSRVALNGELGVGGLSKQQAAETGKHRSRERGASIPDLTLPKEVENSGDKSDICKSCRGVQDNG